MNRTQQVFSILHNRRNWNLGNKSVLCTVISVIMDNKSNAQYCYNPKTKEIIEGTIPPEGFIPIIGYFPRDQDPVELRKIIEEIASL